VTLVGWGAIVGGLVRIFAPQGHQGGENTGTYAAIIASFGDWVFLSIKGYGRENDEESKLLR
jgi:hypothetical protein